MNIVVGETKYRFIPAIVSDKTRGAAIFAGIDVDLMQPVDEILCTTSGETIYAIHGGSLATESMIRKTFGGIADE